MKQRLLRTAERLYERLRERHWDGAVLVGPDVGIRFNARVGRFIKSYLEFIPWRDHMVYYQAQGYWIRSLWQLSDVRESSFADEAAVASDYIVSTQRDEGYWQYPNPEWRGRIATVEGCVACLGLLDTYERTGDETYLVSVRNWIKFLNERIGYSDQGAKDMLAVHYFADRSDNHGGVPNNSTLLLWLLARIYQVTGETEELGPTRALVNWLGSVQLTTGELPYALGPTPDSSTVHFLCYQYNAFEFLDLAQYLKMTGDDSIRPLLQRLANYLSTGVLTNGAARYECGKARPELIYYTASVARALSVADSLGLGDYRELANRGFDRVMALQDARGDFEFYSQGNYGLFKDRRSYPRNLAMILHHLLSEYLDCS